MSTKINLIAPKPGFLQVTIVYGLINRDCRGLGICKLRACNSTNLLEPSTPCGFSVAWAGINEQGRFELLVISSTINEIQWERRFSNREFVMEEAFRVPEELFVGGIELKAGNYPVETYGQYLRISF